VRVRLPQVQIYKHSKPLHQKNPPYVNIDLIGQYFWHTSVYKPYKSKFQALFQPTPNIKEKVERGMSKLRSRGRTIVGLHVRRGDILPPRWHNHARNFPVPTRWYTHWLESIWHQLENPILYIASDSLDMVVKDFKRYRPVTAFDIFPDFPSQPLYGSNHRLMDPSIYPDFYVLTQSD